MKQTAKTIWEEMEMKTTEIQRAAREASKTRGSTWYFCRGNNEGFIHQFMQPTATQCGFASYNGSKIICYKDGKKIF